MVSVDTSSYFGACNQALISWKLTPSLLNVQNAYYRAATKCMVRGEAKNQAPIPSGPRCYGAAVLSHNIYVMFNYYTQLLANYSFPFIMHLPFN